MQCHPLKPPSVCWGNTTSQPSGGTQEQGQCHRCPLLFLPTPYPSSPCKPTHHLLCLSGQGSVLDRRTPATPLSPEVCPGAAGQVKAPERTHSPWLDRSTRVTRLPLVPSHQLLEKPDGPTHRTDLHRKNPDSSASDPRSGQG